jgi:uncharacterized protein YcbK (DUF882 family)
MTISRRNFLKIVAAGVAAYPFNDAFASRKLASKAGKPESWKAGKLERTLNMHNTHTGENLEIKYYSSGKYDYDALSEINRFLRCHSTNEIHEIDVRLLDLLYKIKTAAGNNHQVQIISGYRSPAHNEYLLSLGRRVSPNSLHLQGRAIDFIIPGISSSRLAHTARSFAAGGVGLYSRFVHIDTGRVRHW